MFNYIKKSITRQYLFPILVVMILALFGAIILTYVSNHEEQQSNIERSTLKEKQQMVNNIEHHLMLMVFHARGYYLLKNSSEQNAVFYEKKQLEEIIQQLKQLELSPSEELFLKELEAFIVYFSNELFIRASQLAEANNYAGLRTYSASGATDRLLSFIGQTRTFSEEIHKNLIMLNEEIVTKSIYLKWLFVAYIFVILIILGSFMRKVSRNIGVPLTELTKASESVMNDRSVQLTHVEREDELGILSRAFMAMVRSIQGKEEELLSQNEKLIAQQETLEQQQQRLEASLLELKNLNIAIHESSNVVITDQHGTITDVNDKVCEVSKYTKEELIGQNHNILKSNFHSKEFFGQLWKTINSGHIWKGEIKNKAKDGSFYWMDTTIVPYLDQFGKPYQHISVKKDITDIKLAEEKLKTAYEDTENRRRLNQDIIDHVNEGITFIDNEGYLIDYNKKITEILDFKTDKRNSSFKEWSLLFEERVVQFKQFLDFLNQAIFTQYDNVLNYRYELKSPNSRIFDIYAVPIRRNEKRLGTLIVHRDITKEYEVDQMKSELVSTVSHELRTPLSSVLGFTELILTKELKPERKKKYLETIHKEASRLTNLINDFLDIQRMELGKQTYENKIVYTVLMIKEVINTFQTTNKDHQLILNYEEEIIILGDEEKLIQLFTNLISNAIKFSPEGGKVIIDCELQDSFVVFSVKDEGLGIPQEEVSNLFKKFYRIDNSDRRKIGGTGLGLAISKQIVEAHNGEISVTSTLGEGSTFYVKFPVNTISQKGKVDNERSKNESPTLYIIEDDESLGMLLIDQLKELKEVKLNISQFADGESALEAIRLNPPDLIVLDIMLAKEMDGWAVIDGLKKSESTKDIPIIISSALEEKEKGFLLGIDHYLTKPYPAAKLSDIVLEIILKGVKTGEILLPSKDNDVE